MTLIATPIMVRSPGEVKSALATAVRATDAGADLIEWRVDALATMESGLRSVVTLVQESPLPCIVTCRPEWEGGEYSGSDAERQKFLENLPMTGANPAFMDIELRALDRTPDLRRLEIRGKLILSLHDFDSRPPDFLAQVARMAGPRAGDVTKLAWRARSLRDNLEAFDLLAEQTKPTMALCMGPFGLPSRVLAPKFGGFMTFAAVDEGQETAAGQPTLSDLKQRYRFDSIDSETRVYGVVGWPIEHSLGPLIHNAGFEKMNHNRVYLPLPVPPEWEHFKATMSAWVDHPRLDFSGASVTLPHKENLLRFVDERGGRVDIHARVAGAANTLLVSATGGLVCRNTDAPAIVQCIADARNVDADDLAGLRVAVLGAGGVARAAVAGLIQHDAEITVFNRTQDRAAALVEHMSIQASQIESKGGVSIGATSALATERFDVIINCTSIGMAGGPVPDRTPLDVLCESGAVLSDSTLVFETVYAPSQTPFIQAAEIRGAPVILGIDLFLHQAAMQFESWTGERAPMDAFRDAIKRLSPSPARGS